MASSRASSLRPDAAPDRLVPQMYSRVDLGRGLDVRHPKVAVAKVAKERKNALVKSGLNVFCCR